MKNCELCGKRAWMFCESDQASLCWDCDEKVHRANFLVAKHSRSLLCNVCQSPTPWKASGIRLTPTVSVCAGCFEVCSRKCDLDRDQESLGGNDDQGGYEVDDEESDVDSYERDEGEGEYEEDEGEEEEEEDGENQVVPWSLSSSSSPPPPPEVSSSSEDEISGVDDRRLKRMREIDLDPGADDENACSASQRSSRPILNDEATSSNSSRPLKLARPEEPNRSASFQDHIDRGPESRSTAVIRSIQNLHNGMITDLDDATRMILGICKLGKDQNQ